VTRLVEEARLSLQVSCHRVNRKLWFRLFFGMLNYQIITIYSQVSDPSTDPGVNAYMLEQNVGKTMLQFQVIIKLSNVINISSPVFPGADDSVPAAALEWFPGSHERASVQQAGGGSALQPPHVG
jgi:hypothetical protein